MGSRIRNNVKHFYECFCEVAPPGTGTESWIVLQYPDTFSDLEVLKSVPKFAYPYIFQTTVVQHYSFVLTDIESKWTFGFCRHDPKTQTALVILSYLPWHQVFFKFLDKIAVLTHSPSSIDLTDFLSSAYSSKIGDPGKIMDITFHGGFQVYKVECPNPFQLPSIPENRNLTEYYNAVDANSMMVIFASMLFERRIIFTSNKLTRLSACVQSANDIIYPMIWQHIFIPVLPMALIDYLLAPMPFLIGVSGDVLLKVQRQEIGDVVILDADSNTVQTPFDDLNNLPQEVVSSLKKHLKNRAALLGDGVSRAFLRALVKLIGGYREALNFKPGEKVTFDSDKFIETRPITLQPFLKQMLHLQIFQQFIEERLEMLNSGYGFSDEFEIEACRCSENSTSRLKQQYREWKSSMRKEGTAFLKSVKDKANPAVKSAVKTVKDGGKGVKSAYRGLRSKLRDSHIPQQFENGLDGTRDTSHSAPNSPTGQKRPIDFNVPSINYRKDLLNSKERVYSPLTPNSQPSSPDGTDHSRSGTPGFDIPRIDLMTEMQDLLQLHLDTPPVDRSLKPVRSLENFKYASPLSSPEHWIFSTRSGAPLSVPTNKLFLPNQKPPKPQEMQNLLQSPDDVFSSPPVPPRTSCSELFGSASFVVGGGRSENGNPVFLVASKNAVDVVKLPPVLSPRRKKDEMTEDLIRLDSTSDVEDFDPLKLTSETTIVNTSDIPLSITNPLYNYFEPNSLKQNGATGASNDQDLLQEYGIDFTQFNANFMNESSIFNSTHQTNTGSSSKVNSQSQWTKFD